MARELVSGMLDVQLKQLEQNGLQKLDLYHDIQTMRKHIDGLVEAEMRDVVAILVQAQKADGEKRAAQFTNGPHQDPRDRHAADGRTAESGPAAADRGVDRTSEDAHRERNDRQTHDRHARRAAASKTGRANTRHDSEPARCERAVHPVSQFALRCGYLGRAGRRGAADGLRLLKAAQAGEELDSIGRSLESAKFTAAVKSQQAVITVLKALLEKLEGIQGLINSTNEEALALVRELMKRQEEIRKETKQADLKDNATTDRLVDEESKIKSDLAKLTSALERIPSAQPVLEQAKAATQAARGELFDQKKPEAVDDETKALGSLAELERKLEAAGEQEANDKSAAELAQQIKNLEAAQKQVAEARTSEAKAADQAKSNAGEASKQDMSAADALAKAGEPSPLPAAVKSRLGEAQQAAKDAAMAEQSDQPVADKEAAQQTAQEATERAAAEIAAALADTKLNQKAVSAGELARAAEALERAAASERDLAKTAQKAADEKGLSSADAQKAVGEQMDIKKVAEKIAEGVKDRSAEAANALDQAKQPINDTGHDLVAAEKNPGDATKPQDRDAAQKAASAAEKLSQAAADLRKEVAKEAHELAKIADEQLKPVTDARDKVEKVEGKQPESVAQALDKLNQAEQKTAEAAANQQRAEGRPQAAAAQERRS